MAVRSETNKDRPSRLLSFLQSVRVIIVASACTLLRFLRALVNTAAPLRLHLLILTIVWYFVHTSQYTTLNGDWEFLYRWLATFGFYLVVLGTAFRLTALKENPTFWKFVTLVSLGTAYWISLPKCRVAAVVTIFVALTISNVSFNYPRVSSPERKDNPWQWDIGRSYLPPFCCWPAWPARL
jgi:hypothetical protein